MSESLWGEAFDIKPTQNELKKAIKKTARAKKSTVAKPKTIQQILKSKVVPIKDKLLLIKNEVLRVLGVYKENTVCIRSRTELHRYIDVAIANGVIAIDTETNNSLDPLTCLLMGACIYTPGEKNAYIPINHTDLDNNLLPNQLSESDIKEEFDRLKETKIIMHNGKFDYEVIKCTCNCDLDIYWDTMVGSKILNNTEKAGLKEQYISKIDSSIEKYSITSLFDNIPYAYVDPEIFAYYAATDAFMTYELYQYQVAEYAKPENIRLYYIFKEVEMPIVKIAGNMELTGIYIDQDYAQKLAKKYHLLLDDIECKVNIELNKYKQNLEGFSNINPEVYSKLDNPINIDSNTQLAILLYDILKIEPPDKKNPRGVGENILNQINIPLTSLILKKRGLLKLVNTYIDKLPKSINENDKRLHAQFNSIGTDTGRFSSSSPNLQNIPSHNKDIRMIFAAEPGNVLVGSDFSQQEVRLMAEYSNDQTMLDAYIHNKDFYATVASKVYHNNYEDNLEHFSDGSLNPAGKKRRSNVKSIVLGLLYGRSAASIAEQTGETFEEASKIIETFFNEYKSVKEWIDKTHQSAHQTGFVEDLWGRQRKIPDILLPNYEVNYSKVNPIFNPLLGSTSKFGINNDKLNYYKTAVAKCKTRKEINNLKLTAAKDGIYIKDNTGFIASAERQCVNARIQGSAATLTKLAMIKIANDSELNELGFKMLICVHDEIIGECPEINSQKVADRLSYLMVNAAPELKVPMKCDATIEQCWYLEDFFAEVQKEFNDLINKGDTKQQAFDKIAAIRIESTIPQLHEILDPLMV